MFIRLLTVDAAGTLVRPWPSVGAVYGRTAREHGIEVSDEEVNTEFYKTFGRLQTCKQTNEGEESEFWRQVVTQTFRPFAGNINLVTHGDLSRSSSDCSGRRRIHHLRGL